MKSEIPNSSRPQIRVKKVSFDFDVIRERFRESDLFVPLLKTSNENNNSRPRKRSEVSNSSFTISKNVTEIKSDSIVQTGMNSYH